MSVQDDAPDLQAMFAARYPGWRFTRTAAGWWATRAGLVRESLVPDGRSVVHASTPASLMVELDAAERAA